MSESGFAGFKDKKDLFILIPTVAGLFQPKVPIRISILIPTFARFLIL